MKHRLILPVVALALVAGSVGAAQAEVTSEVTGTTTEGGVLSILGTGVNAALSASPGTFSSALGVTALTVEDLRGTANGWSVTATYGAPALGKSLGGENVLVSVGGVTPDLLGGVSATKVKVKTDEPLTSAVTVATTADATATNGTHDGSGITAMTASLKVRIPVTAKVGEVYGGKVTYTVASVR